MGTYFADLSYSHPSLKAPSAQRIAKPGGKVSHIKK
jgi:hypothetical protein